MVSLSSFHALSTELRSAGVTLVAVSKMKPVEDILALYDAGQRDFGENYVQELVDKESKLPNDIHWHFIGHLQSNKVKYIAPFVHLVQGVDSLKLLQEINKQGKKVGRRIGCLLQVHIAREETKFGFDAAELEQVVQKLVEDAGVYDHVEVQGLMGMASLSEDEKIVRSEFRQLKDLFDRYTSIDVPGMRFRTLSMGMSGDYRLAIAEGSNLVRIGSLLFGAR